VTAAGRAGLLLAALSIAWAGTAHAKTRFFPLPMYTTVPNEGSTFGAMPVFVVTPDDSEKIRSITAPSLSWNKWAGVTGTYRYFRYFNTLGVWYFIASASTNINRSLWYQYDDNRREPGTTTKNFVVRVRRNLFYRFFGLGPDTTPEGESSYTRLFGVGSVRWGLNLRRNVNVAVFGEMRGNRLERHTIGDLPATQDLYPNAPGINGAMLLRSGLSARYDTREDGDYSENGFASELSASLAGGISGAGMFADIIWNTRLLMKQTSFLQLAARVYWRQLIGDGAAVPFYDQASLGGELLLRGFPTDRFIDMGAWEAEIEQRIRLFETHIFGVAADWRIDPFVAVGQVYGGANGPFSHVRVAGGLGLRMWVKPNVLGRVDVAYAGEGLRAYVILDYPF
jgi:hypothetical protein